MEYETILIFLGGSLTGCVLTWVIALFMSRKPQAKYTELIETDMDLIRWFEDRGITIVRNSCSTTQQTKQGTD